MLTASEYLPLPSQQISTQTGDHRSIDQQRSTGPSSSPTFDEQAASSRRHKLGRKPRRQPITAEAAEAWLLSALENSSAHQARDTWSSFNALPLDRRKALPVHVLSQVARIQKTLQLKRRGYLWDRLNSIYQIWQQHESIPIEEIRDTLELLHSWFQQKDVPHSRKEFRSARQLCVVVARLLNPYSEVELLEIEKVTEIVSDYGSTENYTDLAISLGVNLNSPESRRNGDCTRPEAMKELYSRIICGLAQRRKVEEALTLTSCAWDNQLLINVENCGRDIIVAMSALNPHDPEMVVHLNSHIRRVAETEGSEHPIGQWFQKKQSIQARVNEIYMNNEHPDMIAIIGSVGDQDRVALSFVKNKMRFLLTHPKAQFSLYSKDSTQEASIAVQILHKALEAMKLYDEYLSHGYETDRELYRIAKMAKRRFETHSHHSPSLRNAAHLRAKEERDKDARNFKKKWRAPRMITGHWEDAELGYEASEQGTNSLEHEALDGNTSIAQEELKGQHVTDLPASEEGSRNNIYANATAGQILHLAIELGDIDLARGMLPLVMDDPSFSWTFNDDDRAISLLRVLIQDASRADIPRHARHAATQLACSFYAKWQEDLAREPKDYIEKRGQVSRDLRSPAFNLLRLLAHHQKEEGFARAVQTLVQDPSIKLSGEHIRLFAKHVLRSSNSLPWVAFKLHITKDVLARWSTLPNPSEVLDRAVVDVNLDTSTFDARTYIRWCETVLHFMRHLDVSVKLQSLKDVLDMYEGRMDTEEDSLAAYIVSELRKADIKPAGKIENMLLDAELHTSSAEIPGLLKLLKEGSVKLAARSAEEHISVLLAKGQLGYAHPVYEILAAASEQSKDADASEIANSIQAIRSRLGLQTLEQPVVTVTGDAVPDEVELGHAELAISGHPYKVQHSTTPEREVTRQGEQLTDSCGVIISDLEVPTDFLGEFFSDPHHIENAREKEVLHPFAPEPGPWNEAAVGFQDAVDPEGVQVAAAETKLDPILEEQKHQEQQTSFDNGSSGRGTLGTPIPALAGPSFNQSYSTLASQPAFFAAQAPIPPPSILHDISQLPQQFANLTMEQMLALKRRCEIEMEAMRRKDEQVLAARRIALSRADASRWQGWQEFQATPWY